MAAKDVNLHAAFGEDNFFRNAFNYDLTQGSVIGYLYWPDIKKPNSTWPFKLSMDLV